MKRLALSSLLVLLVVIGLVWGQDLPEVFGYLVDSETSLTVGDLLSCDTDTEKLETDAAGLFTCGTVPAAVTPAGSTGDVQFNDGAGGFTGESAFNYDTATNILVVDNVTLEGKLLLNECANVPSATSVAVGDCNVVEFTGTTLINEITDCEATTNGKLLLVLCGSNVPFQDDGVALGNIQLSSNVQYDCTADQSLLLYCDGSSAVRKWVEVSRSAALSLGLRGSSQEVLYNNSGVIDGATNVTLDDSTGDFSASGLIDSGSLEISNTTNCLSDTQKLETDGSGLVSCGTIPAIPALPVSKANGGTGVTSWSADSVFTTDSLGLLTWAPTVAGGFVGVTKTQTLTNKTLTAPAINGTVTTTGLTLPAHTTSDLVSSSGVFDSSLATAGTAFQFDATAGGHTGDLAQIYDGGTTKFTFTDEYNLEFDDNSYRKGGIWQGWSEASFSAGGAIQPENGFYQAYTGAFATSKFNRVFYVQSNPNFNSSATGNSFVGMTVETKHTGTNTGATAATSAGGQFSFIDATAAGGDLVMDLAAGGLFSATYTGAGTNTYTNLIGGQFVADPTGGTNKTTTNVKLVELFSPSSTLGAGGSVGSYAGIWINDLRNDRVTATTHDAIRIASQTADGSVATDGNLRFAGGAWNTGHIQIENWHIWTDGTDLFYNDGTPADATDGIAFTRSGAAPPATCNPGAMFVDTDETDDTNCTTTNDNSLCLCTSANTWTALENN